MTPLVSLILDWVITALWPLIGGAGMAYYSGVLFSTVGLLIGVLVMSPWLLQEGRWRRILLSPARWPLLAMGFFSGTATIVFICALAYTTPANAAIMAQIEVLYSAVLCRLLLGERMTWEQAAASALVVAGTGLIMAHDLTSPRWRGDLMILATPWMYQLSHIFSKRLPKDDAVTLSGGRAFYGVVTALPVCAWLAFHGARWSWQAPAVTLLLVQGVLMSSLNLVLWYKAIAGMDLAKATAIMLSYPALTLVFSGLSGRETIHAFQLVGLAVTFAGAYWISVQIVKSPGTRTADFKMSLE